MPDRKPPDYDAIERAEWRENAKLVHDEVECRDKRLMKRVNTFIDRFGFELSIVIKKLKNDQIFAAHFAKEPRRTGLHEKHAAKWIQGLPLVSEFHVLPKGGPGAIYVTSDGNIHRGPLGNRPGKSLDFIWKTGDKTCYAMHKYTREGGGNQDSQHKEMVSLMRNFQSCNDRTCALFIIADGPYYVGEKMNELRNHIRTTPPRSYAIPIQELPSTLRGL